MTPEEEIEDLKRLSEEIATANRSPWEPRVVCDAFSRDACDLFRFTMQVWIDLEAVRSPLLLGRLPDASEDPQRVLQDALRAFGLANSGQFFSPDLAIRTMAQMLMVIEQGFRANVRMMVPGENTSSAGPDGFGDWQAIFSCLVAELGLRPQDALDLRVDAAFVLLVGHRRNNGRVAGSMTYAEMELQEQEVSDE